MLTDLDVKIFTDKYPLNKYSATVLKVMLNDVYRMELSEEDLKFLKDLNCISDDDFEIAAMQNKYFTSGMQNFFAECTPETDIEFKNFIKKKEYFIENDVPTRTKALNIDMEEEMID